MSSPVGLPREIASSPTQRYDNVSFSNITKDFPYCETVEKIVGRSLMTRIMDKKDLQAEALLHDKQMVGLIVYKNGLQSRFHNEGKDKFEIKKIMLLSPDSSSKNYKQELLNRVITLAKRNFAKGVLITIEDSSNLLSFLQEKEFSIVKSWEKTAMFPKEHLIEYNFPSNKTSIMPTSINSRGSNQVNNGSSVGEEVGASSGKRKARDEEPEIFVPNKSRNISVRTHILPMKGTIYFEYIMSGVKKFEGRVSGPACNSMRVGDRLKLFDRREGWGIICEIVSKDNYRGFQDMLEAKGVLPLLPQLEDKSKWMSNEQLLQEGLRVYQSFPGSFRVNQFGAAAIGVKFIEKIYN
ncbi:MAG: hypothetical protein K940chlam5_00620 [Candidatus Anoxychlamydiales bacterium]|nr:hypothetical protein [Candidatus Anoxychlamydiales bacterium]